MRPAQRASPLTVKTMDNLDDSETDKWDFAGTIEGQFLIAKAHLRLTIAKDLLPTLIAENNLVRYKNFDFALDDETLIKNALKWADMLIKENAITSGLPPQYYQ